MCSCWTITEQKQQQKNLLAQQWSHVGIYTETWAYKDVQRGGFTRIQKEKKNKIIKSIFLFYIIVLFVIVVAP